MRVPSYTETDPFEMEGATFQLGVIPRGQYTILSLEGQRAVDQARRRALLDLKAQGNATPSQDDVAEAARLDPAYIAALELHMAKVVAWGVRGHAGVQDSAGAEVPFAGAVREYLGGKYPGASDETVAMYGGAGILVSLYNAVSGKQQLDQASKKNSPPPQASTPGSSPAPTASNPRDSKS